MMVDPNRDKKELLYSKVKSDVEDDLNWIRRVVIDLYERDCVITEVECMRMLDSLFKGENE